VKRFYLVRHGQTAWNSENRLQGHTDLPLNDVGRQQAQRVGEFFAAFHMKGLFTSHLQRSQQTAQVILAGNGHGVTPVVEQGLAECNLGAWEGLTPLEIDAQFEGAYQQWRTQPSRVQIPRAEPLADFRLRVRETLERMVATTGEGHHVLVTHGGVIAALLADVLEADYDNVLRRLRLDNAGVTALDFSQHHPHVLWINWTAHLHTPPHVPGEGWY
jgi:broad specificity phosphatase PhoE